ncbi:filamentous hemagglutinin N-terminal domain-containing protein [Nitrosospira sp. NpAV]|uniref:two-partner secretion domain-containing protein n=1 Tax=Nitrosospira sp. NpAV TaxID=58133 RepID=UPI000A755057|nr:filamentous hemagglutinin N-terminal domain-containing protein [Nitrosospira sp. NpAV]
MNRKLYRLIFSAALGMRVPAAETARSRGKAASGATLLLTGLLLGASAQAELPVPCAGGSCGGGVPDFVTAGQANYHVHDHQAIVNQVGDKAILNWESFNVSPGHSVQFQQVESLAAQNLVQGANFTTLNRVWDNDPSVIAGIISQAAGQNANIILVNTNGIAFMGSSQVNLGSFTASSLDIADSFILNSFLTPQKTSPQFEGTGGFIKVFEGARITAGSQGRVMLIAPTVINKGTVESPDGQVIAAAGTKVFLRSASALPIDSNVRGLLVEVDSPVGLADFETANSGVKDGKLDGQTVALKESALDKLGHVTNLGELSTPRGNITMVGYAVNQQGIARATTSVIANGSVYLLAKDAATGQDNSTRGGRAVLGAGSLTEVLPDVSDNTGVLDGLTGTGLVLPSQVKVVGQDVRMEGSAVINAPAGEVNFIALDNPGLLFTNDPITQMFGAPVSDAARVHIASGARINVAGLENVAVSTARNGVEVELRGDELKDSPVNRDGPLRSQKVFVDINRALANANAGKPTLIAKDSLQSYQARLERNVAERSTEGGDRARELSGRGHYRIRRGDRPVGRQPELHPGQRAYHAAHVPRRIDRHRQCPRRRAL